MKSNQSAFILFKTEDEKISVDVRFDEETVWLTQDQISVLFGKARTTITEHIKNAFKEDELNEEVACRNFRLTTQHGAIERKTQEISVKHYNLDVIISVGYRVKSLRGTQFRQWATKRLNEYIRKGFTMDDERLKNLSGGGYLSYNNTFFQFSIFKPGIRAKCFSLLVTSVSSFSIATPAINKSISSIEFPVCLRVE